MSPERYLERKLAGLCMYSTGCREPVAPDSMWCAEHERSLARRRASPHAMARARWYRRRHRRRRYAAGLCARCPQPHDPGSFLCLDCEDYLQAHRRRPRRPRKGARHAKAVTAPPRRPGDRVPAAAAG